MDVFSSTTAGPSMHVPGPKAARRTNVGASLAVMERDAKRMRGARPFVFSNLRAGEGVDEIARFIEDKGGLRVP